MQSQITTHQKWEPARNSGALDRQTHAAEYIAEYLSRIDIHLERIANALESGGVNEQLRLQLLNIEKAIEKAVP